MVGKFKFGVDIWLGNLNLLNIVSNDQSNLNTTATWLLSI